jgi:hypothetical protein
MVHGNRTQHSGLLGRSHLIHIGPKAGGINSCGIQSAQQDLLIVAVVSPVAACPADGTDNALAVVLAGFTLVSTIGFVAVSMLGGMTYAMTAHRELLALARTPG